MKSKINELLEKIEALQKQLRQEYSELLVEYGYKFERNKIIFLESIRANNRRLRENVFSYVLTADFRHLLSVPFIYGMCLPLVLLDLGLWVYQTAAFPLYRIPKVRRSDYVIFDRQYLDYLNLVQKVNCLYCSYANGLLAYAVEIAGATERYWCPVKAARRPRFSHRYYREFADYGDAAGFVEVFNDLECFNHKKTQQD
jgi:hypothetical protein